MIIDLRIDAKSAGRANDPGAAVSAAVLRAAAEGRLDPTDVRVVGDWVQYRSNFRAPVETRPVIRPVTGGAGVSTELAVDLRQVCGPDAGGSPDELVEAALEPGAERCYLEEWVPLTESCIWRFNTLYWENLALWEVMLGRTYEEALPGGQSGGTQVDATSDLIRELFRIWDGLAARRALPDQLTVLEIGVGSGAQAKVWLDQFARLDAEQGNDYYRRLNYLMADYSSHVLERARASVAAHRARTSTLVLDAARPSETLRFLETKIFLVYISNVYDNLPTEEVASFDGTLYRVQARACLPAAALGRLAEPIDVVPDRVPTLVGRYLKLGPELLADSDPEHFADPAAAVRFGRDVWQALQLQERYVPLGPLDLYRVCPEVSGELLGPLLDGYGDLRMHVSTGAAASFLDTLPLLHPHGLLTCHDLFVTDLAQYTTGFRGPGKYDGSVVNWVNGPLLASVAARRGYQVGFAPFGHGSRSAVTTMTARARD